MKALYLDDSVDTCDCCGRTGLKVTVAMQLDNGGILRYGRTCASRNSGKNQRQIKEEIKTNKQERRDAACAEFHAHPATLAWKAKEELLAKKFKWLKPSELMEKMEPEATEVDRVRAQIAFAYNMCSYEVY